MPTTIWHGGADAQIMAHGAIGYHGRERW